jgi:membrane-bound metal-dependent hydrolase YbcI (DUF457 family)
MFVFAHLFAGALLGVALARYISDNRIILFCCAGAVLPDFIDKPLGYLLFPFALDSVRTFFHAFAAAAVIAIIAFIGLRYRRTILLFGIAGGVVVHQLVDAMWHEPVTWFFPLLGPFVPFHYVNYFTDFFWLEITSLSEWLFLCSSVVLFSCVYGGRLKRKFPSGFSFPNMRVSDAVTVLMFLLAAYSVACGVLGVKNIASPYNTPEGSVIMGLVALAGAAVLWPECSSGKKGGPRLG